MLYRRRLVTDGTFLRLATVSDRSMNAVRGAASPSQSRSLGCNSVQTFFSTQCDPQALAAVAGRLTMLSGCGQCQSSGHDRGLRWDTCLTNSGRGGQPLLSSQHERSLISRPSPPNSCWRSLPEKASIPRSTLQALVRDGIRCGKCSCAA